MVDETLQQLAAQCVGKIVDRRTARDVEIGRVRQPIVDFARLDLLWPQCRNIRLRILKQLTRQLDSDNRLERHLRGLQHNAAAAGADMIGLNFYRPSPRAVTPQTARDLAARLPSHVQKVGLFVDSDDETIDHTLASVDLDLIQLHGAETPDRCRAIADRTQRQVIKAFRLRDRADLDPVADYARVVDWLLFDAKPPDDMANALPGGNGDPAAPFPNIDYAMTYGNGCTDIVLQPGTYDENVDYGATDWTITSSGGAPNLWAGRPQGRGLLRGNDNQGRIGWQPSTTTRDAAAT